MKTFAEDLEFP